MHSLFNSAVETTLRKCLGQTDSSHRTFKYTKNIYQWVYLNQGLPQGESDWNSHLENSCNSKSNTFLWSWLGLQSITSLKSLYCLKEASRSHVERMTKCTMYTCKDKPHLQLHYNFNHVTTWILCCYLNYDLKSIEILWERTWETREEAIRRVSHAFAHNLPMQCFCCTLSPVTTLLP